MYALLFVFIVTFIVFPAIAFDTNLKMFRGISNSEGWFVLFINTVFSIFDTVGRKVGGIKAFDLSYTGVRILTIARLLFVVTFYLIAFEKLRFNSDWVIIVNMILFSFTNGYASTLCAVKAPGTVTPEDRGQVGGFIGTTITLGILIGSIIAVAETPIIKMTPGYN